MPEEVRLFISYAEQDRVRVRALLTQLKPHLAASRRFRYHVWEFSQLLVGERWCSTIQSALSRADFGLLMLSANFVASNFITRVELPHFLNQSGPGVLPVGLGLLDFRRHDLKGLLPYQVFRLHNRYSYSEVQGPRRELFVLRLFQSVDDRVAHDSSG